jgi:hypothetical protein
VIAKDANEALDYLAAADCNDFAFVSAGRFTPDHEWDFGEVHSVFAPLVRQYSKDVGKFLGKQDDGYIVAILNPDNALDLLGCEVYDNIDELHGEWQLDMNHELVK